MTELPDWVWRLLDALNEYEETHGLLYTYDDIDDSGTPIYQRVSCFGGRLTELKAWPPREVLDAAEFRRKILRDMGPAS